MSRISKKKKDNDEEERMKIIKENLTCSVLKKNYLDDPSILLGYPIVQTKSKFNPNKIELYPIPEMLSYEGFLSEIDNQQQKLDFYFETHFKSSNEQEYNCWIPVYINKEHYEKNKTHVLNSFSIIKYGPEGKKEYDFKPDQIFEILPVILNKMIIGMFSGKAEISSKFIRSYFQYVLLYKKLCLEFEDENLAFLNKKLSLIYDNNYNIDKKIIPDIGNFFMILFYCNKDTHEESMQKMWNCLFEEHLTRQMFWMFHSEECKNTMKRLVLKTKNDESFLTKYENDANFKMKYLDKFIDDLNKKNLYDQIVDIISKDEKYLENLLVENDKAREKVMEKMNKKFKDLFTQCSDDGKKQIKKIISDNLSFSEYFDLVNDELYDNFKVSEILKNENIKNKEEILKYAYESQKGNRLLIITFFAQKKIEEKGFLEELEKNYGIYLDVDDFIKDMNKKIEEIKSIKELNEYIGSDFGKDKTEMELIIEAYDRAKSKGYIDFENNNQRLSRSRGDSRRRRMNNESDRRRGRGFDRGRGRGIGIGRGGSYRGRGFNRGRGRGFGGYHRGRGFYRGRGSHRGELFRQRDRNRSRSRSRSRERRFRSRDRNSH